MMTTYSLIAVWAFFWVVKSSTYRSGLFLGLISFYGMLINQTFILLPLVQYLILYFLTLKDRTWWYKRQTIKYATFGWMLSIALVVLNLDQFQILFSNNSNITSLFSKLLYRKAFFILSIFGFVIVLFKYLFPRMKYIKDFNLNTELLRYLIIMILFFFVDSFVFDSYLFRDFSMMWVICYFSLIPIELIFQSITRMRSSRNMIYFVYILICLLDSHFEGRVKIFLKLLD
jgi:hypothetical protein